jgi:hypothetical protein
VIEADQEVRADAGELQSVENERERDAERACPSIVR